MIGRAKVIKTVTVAATVISCLTLPAHSDPFSKRAAAKLALRSKSICR